MRRCAPHPTHPHSHASRVLKKRRMGAAAVVREAAESSPSAAGQQSSHGKGRDGLRWVTLSLSAGHRPLWRRRRRRRRRRDGPSWSASARAPARRLRSSAASRMLPTWVVRPTRLVTGPQRGMERRARPVPLGIAAHGESERVCGPAGPKARHSLPLALGDPPADAQQVARDGRAAATGVLREARVHRHSVSS